MIQTVLALGLVLWTADSGPSGSPDKELVAKARAGDAQAQSRLGSFYSEKASPPDFEKAREWLERAADQGQADAMRQMGRIYERLDPTARDTAEAAKWYTRATDHGDLWAQTNLGVLFIRGDGVRHDRRHGLALVRSAAESGSPRAQATLAHAYLEGEWAFLKDYAQAHRLFAKAAAQGDGWAEFHLAKIYEEGLGVPVDNVKAAGFYRSSALHHQFGAALNLGNLYAEADDVLDCEEAAKWMGVAAGSDSDSGGMYNLGRLYAGDYSKCPGSDIARAHELWLKAAELGHAGACWNLALQYRQGEGVTPDVALEQKWMLRGAELGSPDAQASLGYSYLYGSSGFPKDYALALRWSRRAADQGNDYGACNLGLLYWDGNGVSHDDREGARLFRVAADKGNSQCQFNMGVAARDGRGVPQDYATAYIWFSRAAAQDLTTAQMKANEMASHLTAEEKARANGKVSLAGYSP